MTKASGRGELSHADRAPTVAAALCLTVVGTAAFLILPQFIEAVVADLHFSDQQVGFFSALLMAGSTLSAITATFWVRRVGWRQAALAATVGVTATSVSLLYCHTAWPFMLLQCLAGFFGGSLYSLALTAFSDSRHADRHFGYAVAAQVAFQVIGLVVGPWLVRTGGVNAFLAVFIALNVVAALLVPWLPPSGTRAAPAGERARLCTGPTLLASWLGDRRGRLLPIGASAVLAVVAVLPLPARVNIGPFVASAIVYNFVWNLSLTFQYSTVNAVDRSGRGVATAPAFHAAGGSVGPAVAALLIGPGNDRPVIFLVVASVLVSFACFALATRLRRVAPV